jgi:hypothetical protein
MKLIDAERKYHFAPYTTDSEVFKIELTAEEILNKYTDEGCQEAYAQPTVKPELTDEQSIAHLQSSGWMQRHDKEMYESGLKEQLADDSDSYDSLLPTVQPEPKWIPCSERLPENEYVLISKKPTMISGYKWSVAIAMRTADPRSGKIQWRDSGFGVIQDDKVLAWMPLPTRYEVE